MKNAPRKPRKRSAAPRLSSDLTTAIAAALDTKAIELGSAFTDFFVICTGASTRQVQAIADGIEDALRARGTKPALVEGRGHAEWVLVDYFDFIVHVFTPATREFYALERLWGDAQHIEVGK